MHAVMHQLSPRAARDARFRRMQQHNALAAKNSSCHDEELMVHTPSAYNVMPDAGPADEEAAPLTPGTAIMPEKADNTTLEPSFSTTASGQTEEVDSDVESNAESYDSFETGILANSGSTRTSFCLEDHSSLNDLLDLAERLHDFDDESLVYSCASTVESGLEGLIQANALGSALASNCIVGSAALALRRHR